MKLIIDIDKETYKKCKWKNNGVVGLEWWERAIANGTPLPDHHGKLKDAEKLANDINALKDNWNRWGNEYESGRYESYDYAVDTIEDAPTIIEGSESE